MAVVLALGVLIVGLVGPWRMLFVSPGELSASHMAIQGGPGEENCSVCHEAGAKSFSGWLDLATTTSDDVIGLHQTDQCLDCHFTSAENRSDILRVHSRPEPLPQPADSPANPTELEVHGLTSAKLNLAAFIHGPPDVPADFIECAYCHQDHLGSQHDMTAMSDAECQVCHAVKFESFNKGHPQFPVANDYFQGITFDHSEHKTRFANEELVCSGCHMRDASGRTMEVKAFETSCAGCHEQGSMDHHGDAIKKNPLMFLQLPEMEFSEAVYWPEDNAYGEVLTPMMALLLAGDETALPLLDTIYNEAYGDLYEWRILLEDNDEVELQAELAASIKRLVAELADYSDAGAEARARRIANAFDSTIDDPVVQNLAAELASASFVMQMFKQRYLPQLDDDIRGDAVSADDDAAADAQWMTSRNMSGWRVDSDEGTISYRPVVHADALLKHWIEALTRYGDTKPSEANTNAMKQRGSLRKRIFDDMKNDFNACTKCHSQEGEQISWTAVGRDYRASGFVKFDHRPHIAMLHEPQNCLTCHVANDGSVTELVGARGFLGHGKAVCETCHTPDGANNTCLNCHQYHETRP